MKQNPEGKIIFEKVKHFHLVNDIMVNEILPKKFS